MLARRTGAWIGAGCLAAVSLFCYLSSMSRFFIGFWNDDARDILAARSLLTGSYASLQVPGHPPLNFPLPGFPLVLCPFAAVFGSHVSLFRIVPLLFIAVSVIAFAIWIRPWLSRGMCWALLALFALNPTTVMCAGRVMADTCYMAGVLGAFLSYRRRLRQKRECGLWMTAALAGFTALVRPEGILLVPAFALPLLTRRRWLATVRFLVIGFLPLLAVWARNEWLTHALSGYTSIWRITLPLLGGHRITLFRNAVLELTTLCTGVLGGWAVDGTAIPLTAWLYTGLTIVAVFAGVWRANRDAIHDQSELIALLTYSAAFLYLHAIWLAVDLHYMWHLLPSMLVFGGLAFDKGPRVWTRWIGGGIMAVLLSTYAYQYVMGRRAMREAEVPGYFPAHTFDWLSAHTPPESFILAPGASAVTLYTGRFSLAFLAATDPDDFRYRCATTGITHLVVQPLTFLFVPSVQGLGPSEIWPQLAAWADEDPAEFARVYDNAAEGSRVYSVRIARSTRIAYEGYLSARDAMLQNRWPDAFAALRQSLASARLPVALNAYAVACLWTGTHLEDARRALLEALRRRPAFTAAALNLARVLIRQHRFKEAKVYFALARSLSTAHAVDRALIPVIDRESRAIPR